jgi:Ni/Co efflux regulator RcnB
MRRVALLGALTAALIMAAPMASQAAGTTSQPQSRTMTQKHHVASSGQTHHAKKHATVKKNQRHASGKKQMTAQHHRAT